MRDDKRVEAKGDSIRKRVRPGDWPRATEEVAEPGKFADGVIEEKIGAVNPYEGYVGYGLYVGTDEAEFEYYVKSGNHAGTSQSTIFGMNGEDFQRLKKSFENNPMMLCSWK